MTRGRVRAGADRGQASVELALLLPLVMLLLLAILQVGLLARDVVLVGHASREAARAAATDPRPGAAAAAAHRSSGLEPDRMAVMVSGRGAPGSRVRVTVVYRAPTEVPLVGSLLNEPTIRSTTTMRVEGPTRGRARSVLVDTVTNWVNSDIIARDSRPVAGERQDLGSGRRNGTQSGRAGTVLGRSPAGAYRLSLHQPSHPSSGSGGAFWRIDRRCSSEPAEPWPVLRRSPC